MVLLLGRRVFTLGRWKRRLALSLMASFSHLVFSLFPSLVSLSLVISHLNKTTTYEDPRKDWGDEPPQPREVELTRHPELGFGFVAGSEKPVIVRYVA